MQEASSRGCILKTLANMVDLLSFEMFRDTGDSTKGEVSRMGIRLA